MNALFFVAVLFAVGISACLSRHIIDKTFKKMCPEHEGIELWQSHSCIKEKKERIIDIY